MSTHGMDEAVDGASEQDICEEAACVEEAAAAGIDVDECTEEQRAALPRRLRKDAERNRARIIEAAREVLAEQGLEVSLEDIARRAGVGIGTLYRRFPNRQDLIEAALLAKADEYLDAARVGLEAPDGWTGFTKYLERICELQADDRSMTDVLTLALPDCPTIVEIRNRIYYAQLALIERAKAEGSLRADFVSEDVILLLLANRGVVAATAEHAPDAWRRLFGLTLDALRAEGASSLPDPPSPQQVLSSLRTPRPGRPPGC